MNATLLQFMTNAHGTHFAAGRLFHAPVFAGKPVPFVGLMAHGSGAGASLNRVADGDGNAIPSLRPLADPFAAAGVQAQPLTGSLAGVRDRRAGVIRHPIRVMPHIAGAIAMSRKAITMFAVVMDMCGKVMDHLIGHVRHHGAHVHHYGVVMDHHGEHVHHHVEHAHHYGKHFHHHGEHAHHHGEHVHHYGEHVHHYGEHVHHHGVVMDHYAKVMDHWDGYKHLSRSVKRLFIRKAARPRPHGGTFSTPALPRLRRAG